MHVLVAPESSPRRKGGTSVTQLGIPAFGSTGTGHLLMAEPAARPGVRCIRRSGSSEPPYWVAPTFKARSNTRRHDGWRSGITSTSSAASQAQRYVSDPASRLAPLCGTDNRASSWRGQASGSTNLGELVIRQQAPTARHNPNPALREAPEALRTSSRASRHQSFRLNRPFNGRFLFVFLGSHILFLGLLFGGRSSRWRRERVVSDGPGDATRMAAQASPRRGAAASPLGSPTPIVLLMRRAPE